MKVDGPAQGQDYTIRSLARGLAVLRCFEGRPDGLTLSQLCELTQLSMPTAFRIVRTLVSEGFLEESGNGNLQLSLGLMRLARAARDSNHLVRGSERHLRSLAESTGETVNLGVLVGDRVLYLDRLQNSSLVTASVQVGSTLPLACTSMGKVMMAFLPEDKRGDTLSRITFRECAGPNAHRNLDSLVADLEEIRARGWAVQNEELEHGLRSIAAPVTNSAGAVVAAVNIAVSAYRVSEEELVTDLLPPLLSCCTAISSSII